MRAAVGWLERERANSELSIMLVVGLPNSGKSSLINALKLAAKAAGRWHRTVCLLHREGNVCRPSYGSGSQTVE